MSRATTEPMGDVDWDAGESYAYVMCVYGRDGDEPGDCYTRVGLDDAGLWWIDDGDDTVRQDVSGPYTTSEAAEKAAEEVALAAHEGQSGEDADAVRARVLAETAGEPDPGGEWCVYWETSLDDEHVVERYATRAQAEASAEQCQAELVARHPGSLLCGYGVRYLLCGEWVRAEEEVAS